MKNLIAALCVSLALISCSKNADTPAPPSPISLLQQLWLIDSVMIYPDSDVFGDYLVAFNPSDLQYEHFRADGKVYSYGGSPTVHYDTTAYNLLSDNATLLIYPIVNGVTSALADTAHVMKLTEHSLMFRSVNSVGEHARWVLKR